MRTPDERIQRIQDAQGKRQEDLERGRIRIERVVQIKGRDRERAQDVKPNAR